jgi:CelD/BcsL family acetyltransferase involved in cellulose biosynthesis/UDP-N-acetylglucosamine transferase subunit ALG13
VIFVILGTHRQPFARLIDALETLPSEALVVQYGHSPAPGAALRAVPFMPFSEVLEEIGAADVVVTHAGVGSILCATRAGHTPVVVPRLKRHGEHVDDHQVELTAALAERGMVLPAWDMEHLAEAVRAVPPRRQPDAEAERPIHSAVRAELAASAVRRNGGPGASAPRRQAPPRAAARAEAPALRLERADELGALENDWRRLADEAGDPFRTWEWTETWWRHFGRERRLALVACRDSGGDVRAIVPVYEARRRPLRLLRFLGHGPGDHLGPVCARDDRALAADALAQALTETRAEWDLFLGERLPSEEGWASLLGSSPIRHEPSPVLATNGMSWDDYLSSRSANFRSQLRRRERKLSRAHEVRYRLVESPQTLETDMTTLCRLHRARWGNEGSQALSGAREAFHRDFASRALARGWLRLWMLEIDGRTVAGWYGLRFGEKEWYYQAGRDPAWDDASVGSVLFFHTVREAFNDGVREYRLLRGDEAYKGRLASSDPGLDTVAWGSGWLGRTGRAAARTGAGLSPRARHRLSRLVG